MFANKAGILEAMRYLENTQKEFQVVFEHGSLSVEIYKPDIVDKQTPHKQDEVYVIAAGKATFELEGKSVEVNAGDLLFVPAGAEHRFREFSADFATWVLFYGPKGGETGKLNNFISNGL